MKNSLKMAAGLVFLFQVCLFIASVSAQSPQQVKIGVISGLGGVAAKWNRFQNMGVTLAQEEYQARGWKVEIVMEDSQTNPAKVLSAFNKLTTLDKVDAVFTDDYGFVIAPLVPVVKQRKILTVAASLPHERYCSESGGYFFSMSSQIDRTRPAYEKFFELNPGVKKIALIHFDDPEWGGAYRKVWTEVAAAKGVTIVDTFASSELLPDFKAALTKILAKKPDAIFQTHEPESFFKALRQFNYKGKVVIGNHVYEMQADTNEMRPELKGVYVVDPVISEEFRSRFFKRFGVNPILEAYAGYEGLRSMLMAFEKDRQHPEKAYAGLKYEGVAGPVDYSAGSCAGNRCRWGLSEFVEVDQAKLLWSPG